MGGEIGVVGGGSRAASNKKTIIRNELRPDAFLVPSTVEYICFCVWSPCKLNREIVLWCVLEDHQGVEKRGLLGQNKW